MRTNARIGFTAVLCLGLALSCVVGAEPDKKPQKLPFRCFTEVWNGLFEVSTPVYDRAKGQITWELETKEELKVRGYEALLVDGDAVEIATVAVKLAPAGPRFKAKSKVQATLSLKGVELEGVSRLMLREQK
jgi:hypothetical protein